MAESWATLLSYRLHDLLMFSADTYFRYFEIVNRRTWPALLVGTWIALMVLVMAARPTASVAAARWTLRVMTVVPAGASATVAWFYFRGGFADIHWLGTAWSLAFLAHALVWLACFSRWALLASLAAGRQRAWRWALLLAAAAWPALAPLSQRPLWQAEVLGLAPDATVLLSLGVLMCVHLPRQCAAALLLVPLAWCVFSGATLWAMQQPQALVLPLAGTVALMSVLRRRA